MGGTMRLGAFPCKIAKGSAAMDAYQAEDISERHRHRYEFNNSYRDKFGDKGMKFSGLYTQLDLVEIVEIPDHPWFLAVQFHPEFKSRPLKAHPLFRAFVKKSLEHSLAQHPKEKAGV